MLGGNPVGSGPNDGNNAKIVLDALPSKYDFPALTTSIDKVLAEQKVKLTNLSGNDDEVAQSTAPTTANPKPVEVPFEFTATGDYTAVKNTVDALERSIRPIQVQKMELAGSQSDLTLTMTAKTFYQPEKVLNITKKVVK